VNYYIFLRYNFRIIDNPIFDQIINPEGVIVIYIKPNNNYLRKNEMVDIAWDMFAEKLTHIGIACYEFHGSSQELTVLIQIIKKKNNNILLEDKPTLLFPCIDKEYKICRPFFNYNLKNNTVEISNSESFLKKKYTFKKIGVADLQILPYKKKHKKNEDYDIQKIWKNILKSDLIPLYADKRDYLDAQYTSHLSVYINSGQISVRQIWLDAISQYGKIEGGLKFLSELGWRDFAYHQFYYHPDMTWSNLNTKANIMYEDNVLFFKQWIDGKTGVRIIDAGMNQLREEGWIPNRIRMLVASFLTKNLKISWQKGAEYFLEQLIDADPIINALNWQWVAGTGTDYMPHFRIFNPILQSKKYDKNEVYQNRWSKLKN
jgi:deoxyribodipyrimidine photolyase